MSVLKWVAKNLSLGGLVQNAGSAFGAGLRLIGAETAAKGVVGSTAVAGEVINATVRKAADVTGGAVAGAAEAMGASNENVERARKAGKFVGAVAVGVAGGSLVDAALIGSLAASGTAGAAAFTSGTAALGGGSMAVGQVVAETVTAVSAVSTVALVTDEDGMLPTSKM